ncbi:MAG: methyltransferase domain-containing protein [Cyanobacteria bacterium SBLK]|nr:methyltransferase domain-containing protein [Cyanobacteria bacterium SBLK]
MTAKLKPNWAGEDLLSRFVNLLIQTKPLYNIMKRQARNTMIATAEKNGIPWRETYQKLDRSPAKSLLPEIANSELPYPEYYQVPFHAYNEGNLCWKAAFEAEPATKAIGLRVWKGENLTWQEAERRMRGAFHDILGEYSPPIVRDILDVGCSIGMSTSTLHHYYRQRQQEPVRAVGLDLSPYMLSVAKVRDEKGEIDRWVHGNAEKTEFSDRSFDILTLQFLLHELPHHASKAIFQEMLRILRPGGILGILDNNPKSPVIQNLPPALFLLMKSTEPWSDEFYTFDVEATLKEVGFEYKTTIASDPRHRTIVAQKPIEN